VKLLAAALALLLLAGCQARSSSQLDPPFHQPVQALTTLRDIRGALRPLESLAGHQAVVLAFVDSREPRSAAALQRVAELELFYRPRGVQFVAVYPDANESLDSIAAAAADLDLKFPVLLDCQHQLADALGITQTPTLCLLDGDLALQYRGRLSDSLGLQTPPATPREQLVEAIESQLMHREIRDPQTAVEGSEIARTRAPSDLPGVTYTKDVQPILQRKCQSCHRAGQTAPFELASYDDAVRWSEMIAEVVSQRRMPPWHADHRHSTFRNDRSLTDAEANTLLAWSQGEHPRGNDADAPSPITWASDWSYGPPDAVLELPEDQLVPATGQQIIRQIEIPAHVTETLFTQDRWLARAEVRPGAPAVVHHILVHFVLPGDLPPPRGRNPNPAAVAWTPGEPAYDFPPGSALKIPAGSRIVFEMHYTPNGKEARDRSQLGLTFARQPPQRELVMKSPARTSLVVPANAPHHTETIHWMLDRPTRLLGLMGHMHLRGKSYQVLARYPDRRSETLLSVPRYDFNWQTFYWFQTPPELPAGTQLEFISHWDNSRNNPANPNPNADVPAGWTSESEMQACWSIFEPLDQP
jgi:hypothetical protein